MTPQLFGPPLCSRRCPKPLVILALLSVLVSTASAYPSYPGAVYNQSSQFSLSSISNMASMKGYLTPRCSRSSISTPIALQDCYAALSRLPFNSSDALVVARSVSQSSNSCAITVSQVEQKTEVPGDQESPDSVDAAALFAPVGRVLSGCSNQAGALYLWAGGANFELKIANAQTL